jgi:hypothetical protein
MTSARDLTSRLAVLLRNERAALADFLVALAAFDRERRWLELGYGSLFDFLHRELGLSKGAAFYRKTAAELIRRFPEVVEPLRDGRLCLTSVGELSKVITPENREAILPRFFHVSRTEAKAVSAELCPALAPPRRDVVTSAARSDGRALPTAALTDDLGQAVHPVNRLLEIRTDAAAAASLASPAAPPTPPGRERRDETQPLTGDLSRLHLTVSRQFLRKLEAARAALSHCRPGASAQEILEAGLDLLLAQHAKRKGLTDKPRRSPPPSSPEHLPVHVKRAVWKRDDGRCQWPLEGGGICGSSHRVEFDHVDPRGRGGPSTIENVRLLCDAPEVSPRLGVESRGRSIV